MTPKPILFNAAMVRAILDGTKTQTRRPVKPDLDVEHCLASGAYVEQWMMQKSWDTIRCDSMFFAPYQPGDTLWVRETWRPWDEIDRAEFEYDTESFQEFHKSSPPLPACFRADCGEIEPEDRERGQRWRPSIHMPKWACRIFLEVTAVRCERVQDITPRNAKSEGAKLPIHPETCFGGPSVFRCPYKWKSCSDCPEQIKAFRTLWDSLAKQGTTWDENPWVWAYTFKRCEKPANWPENNGSAL